MKRYSAFLLLWIGGLGVAFGQTRPATPNILLIYTDDQRYDALSVVQQEQGAAARFPWFRTPNLDRLAQEGVRFRNAFVVNSLCSPSRSTMLNGRYNHLNGIANNHTPLTDTTITYATELRKAGYRTAFFGKWHMGNEKGKRPGFDYSFSFIGQGRYQDCPFEENGQPVQTQGWVDDVSTTHAIDYLQQHRKGPFFLALGFKSGHGPFQPAARNAEAYADAALTQPDNELESAPYRGKVETGRKNAAAATPTGNWTEKNDKKIRDYFRTLKGVDENIGRVLQALDSLKISDNTVIVFTSDNGFFFGEHSLADKRAAYEDAIRVPLLVRYPARFRPGKRIDKLVLNLDIAPTILDLAGVKAPASFQGKSWVPLAEDKPAAWRTSFLYEYFYENGFNTPTIKAVRTENSKLILYPGQEDWSELYDLRADPREKKNLYSTAEGAKLKTALTKEISTLEKATGYTDPAYADPKPVDAQGRYIPPKTETLP